MRALMFLSVVSVLAATAVCAAELAPPSQPQAYCINGNAEFYPYDGGTCRTGYQLGAGNCRQTDGRLVIKSKDDCLARAGWIVLPHPPTALKWPPRGVKRVNP